MSKFAFFYFKNKFQRVCDGKVSISFAQSNSNSIPYDKITTDVKNQLKTLFQELNIVESENIFTLSMDIEKARNIGSNYDETWVRDGSVINPKDVNELCGCERKKSTVSQPKLKKVSRKTSESISETVPINIDNDDDDCKPLNKTSNTRFCNLEYAFYIRCPHSKCYLPNKDIGSNNAGMIVGVIIAVVLVSIVVTLLIIYVFRKANTKRPDQL